MKPTRAEVERWRAGRCECPEPQVHSLCNWCNETPDFADALAAALLEAWDENKRLLDLAEHAARHFDRIDPEAADSLRAALPRAAGEAP